MNLPRAAITLAPLDDAEYADFARQQVAEAARQHVNAGEWPVEEASIRAAESEAALLRDELRGTGHVFLKGVDAAGRRIGWIWLSPAPTFLGEGRERTRWLSQITIEEDLRGCGLGRALLTTLHGWLEERGVEELWLRVYDWNVPARRLYAASGYEVMRQFPTDAHQRKRLRVSSDTSTRPE